MAGNARDAAGNTEFDVFLSYNRHDEGPALRLKAALEQRGIRVWFDREQIRNDERFIEALERGLLSSNAAIFLISKASFTSEWVKEEYAFAFGLVNDRVRDLQLIPILLEKMRPPGFLASRNYVDLSDDARFDAQVDLVFRTLRERAALPAPEDQPASGTRFDALEYVKRRVTATNVELADKTRLRKAVLPLCFAVAVAIGVAVWSSGLSAWAFFGATVPVLVGFGTTAPGLARSRLNLARYVSLRDAVELCGASTEEGCVDVRREVFRIALSSTGVSDA